VKRLASPSDAGPVPALWKGRTSLVDCRTWCFGTGDSPASRLL